MRCSRLRVIRDTTVTAVKWLIKLKFQEYLYIFTIRMKHFLSSLTEAKFFSAFCITVFTFDHK
jgi:hypothetical protein